MKTIDITCTGTKLIAINSLTSLQGNLKEKSRQQLDKLKRQIIKYGFSFPMFIWKNNGKNYTLDGHSRDFIIKELIVEGYKFKQKDGTTSEKIPADFIDAKDKKEAKEKLLALNSSFGRITEEGFYEYLNEPGFELDFDSLKMDLELPNIDLEKFEIGWIKDEDKLDEVPEVQKVAISKLGDLFLLDNRHRILAGDSTKKEDVELLLDGKKADCVFTDPPYGVGYKYETFKDEKDEKKYKEFCLTWFNILKQYSKFIIITTGDTHKKIWYEIDNNMRELVWYKKFGNSPGYLSFTFVSEPILVWGKCPIKRYDTNFFEFMTDREDGLHEKHPCPKPVGLLSALIVPQTKRDNLILDLFLGSGSTLIACAQNNRICFALEIEPLYIDVSLRRYHNLYPDKEIKCLTRKDFNFKKLYAS